MDLNSNTSSSYTSSSRSITFSTGTVRTLGKPNEVLLIAIYQSLKKLKESEFLNAFIRSRINYFHEFFTLQAFNSRDHPVNPNCDNHKPSGNSHRKFNVSQTQGISCSFCNYFINDYLPSLKQDWCKNSKSNSSIWATKMEYHPNFKFSDASKFFDKEDGGWEIAKLFSTMRMTTIEEADPSVKLGLLSFHPAFQDIMCDEDMNNSLHLIREERNGTFHLAELTEEGKNALIDSIIVLFLKIKQHWESNEYGDNGFMFKYPKSDKKNIFCSYERKGDTCPYGDQCRFNHNYKPYKTSFDVELQPDFAKTLEELTNLKDSRYVHELLTSNAVDPKVMFQAHCTTLGSYLEREPDIFGFAQPNYSQYIQLELSPYINTKDEGDEIGRREDENGGKEQKEKIKLRLQDFTDYPESRTSLPHDNSEIEENPQSSSLTSSFKLSETDIKQSIHDNLTLVIGAPGSGKSTFSRCLTMALCEKHEETKDIPFLASSKKHHGFFKQLNDTDGKIEWYILFQNLSSSTLISLPNTSSYQVTLIVDGLDELSAPQKIIDCLAEFLQFDVNINIIKRIIITSRPGCVFQYKKIQRHFNFHERSQQIDNLMVKIAPFTAINSIDLVRNLLTKWNQTEKGGEGDSNQNELNEKIKQVQQYALRFAESPILINMICHLSLDAGFNIETATILDIYEQICMKLIKRYLEICEIYDNDDEYLEYFGFVFRVLAYLMHRIGFNDYEKNKTTFDNDNKITRVDIKTLSKTIKSLFKSNKDYWQEMIDDDERKEDKLLDQTLGCFYQSGENSYCFLHRTIQEYLCADFLVKYTGGFPSPLQFKYSRFLDDAKIEFHESLYQTREGRKLLEMEKVWNENDEKDIPEKALAKALIRNREDNVNFDWFGTQFYLSEWWDEVYSFGCQFYFFDKKQNPWCQHLYFRKLMYEQLGVNHLLESTNKEQELVLKTVGEKGSLLQYASEKFKEDREVVLVAVKENGWAIKYASRSLQFDKEIAKIAKQQEKLQYAPKEIVINVVFEQGNNLQYASETMQNDKEVVLAAVTRDGWALKYASKELQNDREVVLAAVKSGDGFHGSPLEYASKDLKNDREILLAKEMCLETYWVNYGMSYVSQQRAERDAAYKLAQDEQEAIAIWDAFHYIYETEKKFLGYRQSYQRRQKRQNLRNLLLMKPTESTTFGGRVLINNSDIRQLIASYF